MTKIIEPSVTPKLPTAKFGFHQYAERLNGRAAMIGLIALCLVEYFTGKGVLTWLGFIPQ